MGSPPLARELRPLHSRELCNVGITPACAGTTLVVVSRAARNWDHPRLRGNYCVLRLPCTGNSGSPPLARELQGVSTEERYEPRITPACAGTTQSNNACKFNQRDHPRLRGNYASYMVAVLCILRITPACAGTTFVSVSVRYSVKDHPRLRGNYRKRSEYRISFAGSPPLARELRHSA